MFAAMAYLCLSLSSTTSRYARAQHEDDVSGASGTETAKCFPIGGARSTLVDQMTLLMETSAAIQGRDPHISVYDHSKDTGYKEVGRTHSRSIIFFSLFFHLQRPTFGLSSSDFAFPVTGFL